MRIGALALHRDLERLAGQGPLVGNGPLAGQGPPAGFGLLPRAARYIGHYAIRASGTFGGSIAHADPAAEWCMAALLFGAEIVACGPGGERVIGAGEFFTGFLETALAPDEMLVEVRLPAPRPGAAICEFARRHGDFAIVAVAAWVDRENGACRDARVVLGGVAGTVQRATGAEAALIGSGLEPAAIEAAAREAAAGTDPPGDIHGSAEYRRHLVEVLTARAVGEAAAHA